MTDKIASNFSQELPFNKFILTEEQTTHTTNSSYNEFGSCSEENSKTPPNVARTIQSFLENEFHCESRSSMGAVLVIILRFSKLSSLERFRSNFYQGVIANKLQTHLVTIFTSCNVSMPTLEFELGLLEEELRHYQEVHIPFQGR